MTGTKSRIFALAFVVATSGAAAAPSAAPVATRAAGDSVPRAAAAGALPAHATLERPISHEALLRASAHEGSVVVVLFSLEGCAYCEALRRDQLVHLAREARERHLRVVEYPIDDARSFEPAAADGSPASPAALARSLQVRVAPSVVFLGADGSEIAERLVGYASPDFYGAFLDRRIDEARARLAGR